MERGRRTLSLLLLRAYVELVRFDRYLARGNFAALYQKVRDCPVRIRPPRGNTIEEICAAVDTACIWYWKQVLCLQRSAATACLLKVHGVPARMAIGAQQLPFRAHAWVEVEGRVVNDKAYAPEMYNVVDRC